MKDKKKKVGHRHRYAWPDNCRCRTCRKHKVCRCGKRCP